jgi:hypothetical protein
MQTTMIRTAADDRSWLAANLALLDIVAAAVIAALGLG